jgi:transglutaminase-like putative cysteine protease
MRVRVTESEGKNLLVIASLTLSLVLIFLAIDSVGPIKLELVSPEIVEETGPEVRLIGLDMNATKIKPMIGNPRVDFLVSNNTKSGYLRTVVGEIYRNGVWRFDSSNKINYTGEYLAADSHSKEDKEYSLKFRVFELPRPYVPTIHYPTRIDLEGATYYEEQQIFSSTELYWETKYEVTYIPQNYAEQDLLQATVPKNSLYTQMPNSLQLVFNPVAEDITKDLETPYQKMKALQIYISENYKYNYTGSSRTVRMDPVVWFLLVSKEGNSLHFNSALVLLARSIGIPARLVGGYVVESDFPFWQLVLAEHRRVYVEVLFEGLGWVMFDAAPPLPKTEVYVAPSEPQYSFGLNLSLVDALNVIFSIIPVIVAALVVVFIVFLSVRRRAKRTQMETQEPDASVTDSVDERLIIQFPVIAPELPHVWSLIDPLIIEIHASTYGSTTSCILYINELEREIPLDSAGVGRIQQSFTQKGVHRLKAVLLANEHHERIESKLALRIVDYKEEVVSIFNQLYIKSSERINLVKKELTVREFQRLVMIEYPDLPEESLEQLASIFEVADYSERDIGRKEYERFYLAKMVLDRMINDD